MGVIRCLKKNTKSGAGIHTHTQTDGHHKLETESAQWADAVKSLNIGIN